MVLYYIIIIILKCVNIDYKIKIVIKLNVYNLK